jgi:hypothetical protein
MYGFQIAEVPNLFPTFGDIGWYEYRFEIVEEAAEPIVKEPAKEEGWFLIAEVEEELRASRLLAALNHEYPKQPFINRAGRVCAEVGSFTGERMKMFARGFLAAQP